MWNIGGVTLGGEHTRFIKQEGSKVFPVHVQLAQSVLVGVTHLEHVILWKKQKQSKISVRILEKSLTFFLEYLVEYFMSNFVVLFQILGHTILISLDPFSFSNFD